MLLQLKNIQKSFGQVTVLKGITLALEQGQILGLIGENGAGKSTLMNLLGGIFPPSDGHMVLNGEPYVPRSPMEAQAKGIALIHQELNLFPNLSIAENLFINRFPKKRVWGIPFLDKVAMKRRTQALLTQVGLQAAPDQKVEALSPAQRQLVEIAKALRDHPQIIIFDEPTTSLSRHEAQQLFGLMHQLKEKGIAMVYISHNLEDVRMLADNIAILRDGELVTEGKKANFDLSSMVKGMVGREMANFYPERQVALGDAELLRVEGLTAKGFIHEVSFTIKKREVVGFYGLVGAGRSEMARVVYGLDPFDSGMIHWKGTEMRNIQPVTSIKNGMAFLTEDRREEGLLTQMNIQKNAQLVALDQFSRGMFRLINRTEASKSVSQKVRATKTKYESLTEQLVATLSGGNQQKIVLAKWLLTQPELCILDEPTKGIDIGAKREIYGLINELVSGGAGVLMISSEIEELIGMCDRILVMSGGRITATFDKAPFDRKAILEAALHKQTQIARP